MSAPFTKRLVPPYAPQRTGILKNGRNSIYSNVRFAIDIIAKGTISYGLANHALSHTFDQHRLPHPSAKGLGLYIPEDCEAQASVRLT